ncbi:hypothetical protein [Paenibacillus sp. FSL R5-0914]|uniref:hypothetical protein n=1 Tax=Paenibacillus sp. FSL R5-0914 TaxID=2921665 RepID=UPI0030F7641B
MAFINKLPAKAFTIYYLLISIWGMLGIVSFPEKPQHLILIVAGFVAFIRSIKLGNSLDRWKSFLGCCLFGILAFVIMV